MTRDDAGELEHQIRALFDRVVHADAGEREALLGEAHPTARAAVRDLILAVEERPEFLHVGDASGRGSARGEAVVFEPDLPDRIARYRISGVLGRGGMGIVYRARQDSPSREVALKLLHPALATAGSQRRFDREITILAQLDHRGIAQIYEAGLAELGGQAAPFFAMELVDGLPCTSYAAEAGLDPSGRVDLLARIVEVVRFAHQNGVIHRDLKPSNILVDQQGNPKLLDFGVARLLDAGNPDATSRTEEVAGTLIYMSPEQYRGKRVDSRADVFSLGVIGFELLTNALPHRGTSRDDVVSALTGAATTLRSPRAIDPTLHRDLDAVIGKAIALDPADRYATADALWEDLTAFLDGRAIRARPLNASERAARWMRRYPARAGLALVLAIGVPTVLFLLGHWRESALEKAQSDRAEANSATVAEGFYELTPDDAGLRLATRGATTVNAGPGPARARARFREVLARDSTLVPALGGLALSFLAEGDRENAVAAIREGRRAARDPSLLADFEAELLAVGDGERRSAPPQVAAADPFSRFVRAMRLSLTATSTDDLDTAFLELWTCALSGLGDWVDVYFQLASVGYRRAQLDADLRYREFLAVVTTMETRWPNDAATLYWRGRAHMLRGDFGAAEAVIRRAVKLNPRRSIYTFNLANSISRQGRYADALAVFDRAIEQSPDAAAYHHNRGVACRSAARQEQTRPEKDRYVAEAIASFERASALDPSSADSHLELAAILLNTGDPGAALPHAEKGAALSPTSFKQHFNLGLSNVGLLRYQSAVRAFRRALENDPANPSWPMAQIQIGQCLSAVGDVKSATAAISAAWSRSHDASVALAMAVVLVPAGRDQEALSWLEQSAGAQPWLWHSLRAKALAHLARTEDAEDELEALSAVLMDNADDCCCRGDVLTAMGRGVDAARSYERALEHDPCHDEALLGLIAAAATSGDGDAFSSWLERALACADTLRPWPLRRLAQLCLDMGALGHDVDPALAVNLAQQADALVRHDDPSISLTLARALRRAGLAAAAAAYGEHALDLSNRGAAAAEGLRGQILAFQNGEG